MPDALFVDTAEELFERAPCGYLSTFPDGTIVRINETLVGWLGEEREALLGRRFADLLTMPGRILHETHFAPLLLGEGAVREMALDLQAADGSRRPVLVSAVLHRDRQGRPGAIRTTIFDATDRRAYERELVAARDRERASREHVERLQRITAALSAAQDPEAVGRAVVSQLVRDFAADRALLAVASPVTGALRVIVRRGATAGGTLGDGDALADWSPRFHEPADRPPRDAAVQRAWGRDPPAASVVLPLVTDAGPTGVLLLGFDEPRGFGREVRAFFTACAGQCAQALERARLFAALKRRAEQDAAVVRLGELALEGASDEVLFAEAGVARATALGGERAVAEALGEREGEGGALARLAGALATGPLVLDDVAAAGADARAALPAAASALLVAVGERTAPLAVLLAASAAPRRFGPEDVMAAQALANVLHTALERQRAEEATRHQALHDPLTGLPNRALLLDRMTHALARARRGRSRVAVLLLDVDHFKVVNDSLGHEAGDDLLRALTPRLRAAVRDEDTVARLGGDEFVVVCADVEDPEEALEVARRIERALAEPFVVRGAEHAVGASIGLVLTAGDASPDALLRDADAAMYEAKSRGRSRVELFDSRLRFRAQERLRVERELRRAVREDELRVFYQPVVALDGGGITALEALVRWQHPVRGLLGPGAFIDVAEETGLIVEVGAAVLQRACRQLAAWRAAIPQAAGVAVAVNLSGREVQASGLAHLVRDALDSSGLGGGDLVLEVTEGLLMETGGPAREALDAFKALGIELALDDFGTGYSSLARLRTLPIDVVKIDRMFVEGVGDGEVEAEAIIAAIVAMAHAMGRRVVAEGVETAEQLRSVRRLGCDAVQGFVFARPLPADECGALLRAGVSAGPSGPGTS